MSRREATSGALPPHGGTAHNRSLRREPAVGEPGTAAPQDSSGDQPQEMVVELVAAATMAPSMHNTQPWRFRFDPASQTIGLYADPARVLRVGDPDGRALHIACGAALFNLRLAAAVVGRQPVVRLIPDRASGCCSRLSGWPGHLSRSSRRLSCTPPSRSAVPTGARSVVAGYRRAVSPNWRRQPGSRALSCMSRTARKRAGCCGWPQDAERGRLRRGFPNAEQPPAPGRCRPRDRGRGAGGRRSVPALRTGFRLASRSANTWSRSSRPPSPHARSCSSWCLTRRLIGPGRGRAAPTAAPPGSIAAPHRG